MSRASLSDWLSWQQTLHPNAIDLGLSRIGRTLARLEWRRPSCPIVTVGGTNGKGSCVAMLASVLAAGGYRVGTFTSPHLLRYNERIVIDGREVSDASLIAAFERIDHARGDDTLTFFEFNAIAALLIFETAGLDAIVLEVGLGGRLDAVNVVDADVALISSIALDHCEWLGADVEQIGREKAGIFRAQRPAVFGSTAMPASVQQYADQIGASLLRLGRDFSFERSTTGWSWHGLQTSHEQLPMPALVGEIQLSNASAVLAVVELLRARLPIAPRAIASGLAHVRLTARFQTFSRSAEWILDVAHNPAAAANLALQLAQRPARRTVAVCGILGDKDIEGIVRALRDVIAEWIVVALPGERALAVQTLADRMAAAGARVTAVVSDVAEGCARAEQMAASNERVVVFGSFLTVAPALVWLHETATEA